MNQRNKNIDFGLVLSLVLLLFALWKPQHPYFIKMAVVTLLLTILIPVVFTLFTRIWLWFGGQIEKIGSFVLLFLLFFCVLTPIAFLMRLFGQDSLRIHQRNTETDSFFIQRVKSFEDSDFKKQF